MSQSQTVLAPAAPTYQLSDDLARLCLPQEFKDSYRMLAWVNSICALFLLIGLVGLKAPKVVVRPLSEVQETVPVVFTPDEPPPPPVQQDTPPVDVTPDTPVDTPQVATVVAIANPEAAAFPVPVEGANVRVATQVAIASAPPPVTQQQTRPSAPTIFNPNAGNQGTFPPPEYPAMAQRNRYQGTVVVEIKVDASGNITSASVFKSSGFSMLDEAALQVVKTRWRFVPGKERWLHWPCTFRMQ